jgi:hypothetical protein
MAPIYNAKSKDRSAAHCAIQFIEKLRSNQAARQFEDSLRVFMSQFSSDIWWQNGKLI